jgi:1-acyl-sn-glycerol-3-phosphate acyltransferase
MVFLSKLLFNILGWSSGKVVEKKHTKYLIVVAPHTSNFDFIYGILFAFQLGFRVRYFAKKELFHWSSSWFFKALGGIPVNRDKNNNLVSHITDVFNSHEKLIVGIAPEGTRKSVRKWKTGFYYIALEAKIPIALAYLDYKEKKAGIGLVVYPSGDIKKDFQIIENFYSEINPKYPTHYNKKIF